MHVLIGLTLFVFLQLPSAGWGQSSLPACPPGAKAAGWHNCFGSVALPNGDRYLGEFREGRYSGYGSYDFATGARYEGEWRNNERHGQGTFTHGSGERYIGEWRNDRYHGQGVELRADGSVNRSGQWSAGVLVQSFPLNVNRTIGSPAVESSARASSFEAAAANFWNDRAIWERSNRWREENSTELSSRPGTTQAVPLIRPSMPQSGPGMPPLLPPSRRAAEVDPERNVRTETEARQLAESKMQDRLAAEARERDRLVSEARELERQAAVVRARERADLEAKDRERLAAELREMREQLFRRDEAAKQREDELQRQLADARSAAAKLIAPKSGRHALVIGIDQYQSIPRLNNAVADAREVASALRGFGYAVREHKDLAGAGFRRAMRDFRTQIAAGDEVVVFYAGHGVQIGGLNYFLPSDTRGESEAEVRDEAVQLQRLLDDLAEAKPSFALVIADACRDNPFKGQGRAIGGRGLSPTTAASGQMILFSAGSNQQALDVLGPDDRVANGVFTRVLVSEMRKPNLPIDRLARNVRAEVVRLAKSVGHEQVPALYDQSIGKFFLWRQ